MLQRLRLHNFKSFENATLNVGPFTIIVGPNSSGKSNIRDAFRFLHGVGRGYTLADIIGGRYGAGGQSEWTQMRGAASEIIRFGSDSFKMSLRIRLPKHSFLYEIEVEKSLAPRQAYKLRSERLYDLLSSDNIFTSHPGEDDPVQAQDDESHLLLRMARSGSQKKFGNRVAVRPDQPALTQLYDIKAVSRNQKDAIELVVESLAGIRFLDLVPEAMRQPAFPGQVVLGDAGDNLPTVLQEICSEATRKDILKQWVRELTPMDVIDFEFPVNPVTGHVQLVLKEGNGNTVSAYSASDGTLRFLAMLAALLGNNPASLYFFEEIDNGIHPARLRLLLDLIEGQTKKEGLQVITTTHSPELLSMISSETFESTSVVFKPETASSSTINRIPDLPNAREMRNRNRLGELHSSGWLEDAVSFLYPENSELAH